MKKTYAIIPQLLTNYMIGSVEDKIFHLKHRDDVKIRVRFGHIQYHLMLITDKRTSDKRLIRLLALWRKRHEQWFPAIFPVTFEGTRRWLQDRVINEPDRILFMIRATKYIGHVGMYRFNFSQNSCEIDNVVRGVDIYPGLMENAIRRMMRWGNTEFGVKTYMLSTTDDNIKALRLYRKLGFMEVKRIPLVKIMRRDRIEWKHAPKKYTGPIARHDVIMKLPYEKI